MSHQTGVVANWSEILERFSFGTKSVRHEVLNEFLKSFIRSVMLQAWLPENLSRAGSINNLFPGTPLGTRSTILFSSVLACRSQNVHRTFCLSKTWETWTVPCLTESSSSVCERITRPWCLHTSVSYRGLTIVLHNQQSNNSQASAEWQPTFQGKGSTVCLWDY